MATNQTKTFSVTVIFSKDTEENLAADEIHYLELKTMIKKRIAQDVECSEGIISSHIVGSVSEA